MDEEDFYLLNIFPLMTLFNNGDLLTYILAIYWAWNSSKGWEILKFHSECQWHLIIFFHIKLHFYPCLFTPMKSKTWHRKHIMFLKGKNKFNTYILTLYVKWKRRIPHQMSKCISRDIEAYFLEVFPGMVALFSHVLRDKGNLIFGSFLGKRSLISKSWKKAKLQSDSCPWVVQTPW